MRNVRLWLGNPFSTISQLFPFPINQSFLYFLLDSNLHSTKPVTKLPALNTIWGTIYTSATQAKPSTDDTTDISTTTLATGKTEDSTQEPITLVTTEIAKPSQTNFGKTEITRTTAMGTKPVTVLTSESTLYATHEPTTQGLGLSLSLSLSLSL